MQVLLLLSDCGVWWSPVWVSCQVLHCLPAVTMLSAHFPVLVFAIRTAVFEGADPRCCPRSYDNGVMGGVVSSSGFLTKFFPSLISKTQVQVGKGC